MYKLTSGPMQNPHVAKTARLCRKYRQTLIFLMALGLIARVAIAAHDGLTNPPLAGSDAREYDSYAWNLAQGRGYRGISPDVKTPDGLLLDHPTAYRVPGTSLFWAGLYRLFGHRYDVVRISQCALDTLIILLIYAIGGFCFTNTTALLAAGIYAVWPTALLYSGLLGAEPLYAFLFCCFTLNALRFAQRPSWPRAIVSGLLLGLAVLTRANGIIMVGLIVPWAIRQFRRTPKLCFRGLAIPMLAIATLAPWTMRNYLRFHSFIPLDNGGGDVLLGSYNRVVTTDPQFYGYWIYPTSELPEYREQITTPNDEVVRNRVEIRLALQWVRAHPEKWLYLVESRFRRSWTPFLQADTRSLYRVGMLMSWGPILVLFTIGFFPTAIHFLRINHPGWLIHLGICHFVFTAIIFWGASRFRYPIEGLCIIIASATAVWVCQRARRRPLTVAQ